MNMIEILLSTYNGDSFLEEQINSILNQTFSDWNLLIRDDGSTDRTIEIINNFKALYPNKISNIDASFNVGVLKSFEILLNYSTSQYIMFCDQDDIWLPTKIEKTFAKMMDVESIKARLPILIHTDLKVVSENLDVLFESFWNSSRTLPELLTDKKYLSIHNGVTGCTIMINKAARDIVLPFSVKALMHDSWIALNVLNTNGVISYVDEPLILYRQHSKNVIGASKVANNFFLKKIVMLKSVILSNSKQIKMLRELGNFSLFFYFFYKIKYNLKIGL